MKRIEKGSVCTAAMGRVERRREVFGRWFIFTWNCAVKFSGPKLEVPLVTVKNKKKKIELIMPHIKFRFW